MKEPHALAALLLFALVPLAATAEGPGSRASREATQPRCVIFFEDHDCNAGQSRSSCCTEAGSKMSGCWTNDEARSMKVFGGAGTVITVFDDPDARTQDDYFVLIKRSDRPLCVGSFERARSRFDPPATPGWFYSGGNGLDGKVSSFRWSDPREPLSKRTRPPRSSSRTGPQPGVAAPSSRTEPGRASLR